MVDGRWCWRWRRRGGGGREEEGMNGGDEFRGRTKRRNRMIT